MGCGRLEATSWSRDAPAVAPWYHDHPVAECSPGLPATVQQRSRVFRHDHMYAESSMEQFRQLMHGHRYDGLWNVERCTP